MLLNKAIICITGARGTGKTVLAATYAKPSELKQVFYHDAERSANRIVQDLQAQGAEFGYYGDLQKRFSDLPSTEDLLSRISQGSLPWVGSKERSTMAQYYEHILEDLDTKLTQDQFKVYILDTGEKFEAGMVAWVEEHQKQTGAKGKSFSSRRGQFWWGAYYPLYEHFFSAIFGRGVETIILVFHTKNAWRGSKPVPGKVDIGGKPFLFKVSSLAIWLVNDRSNANGEPAGLVLKERLGKTTITEAGWVVRRMIPERIPVCTWEKIEEYLEKGCDLAHPAPGESMSKSEREMISEFLTDEQMKLMMLDAEKELAERGEVIINPSTTVDVSKIMIGGIDMALVRREMEKIKELGMEVSEGTRGEIEEKLLQMRPPPLRNQKTKEVIKRAIDELLV